MKKRGLVSDNGAVCMIYLYGLGSFSFVSFDFFGARGRTVVNDAIRYESCSPRLAAALRWFGSIFWCFI